MNGYKNQKYTGNLKETTVLRVTYALELIIKLNNMKKQTKN